MSEGERLPDPELVGARALRAWITAQPDSCSRVVLFDDGAAVEDVPHVFRHDDVVLLPVGSAPYNGSATAIRYRGALREVGDELFFGERGIELQDYVAAAFVQIVGPTVVGLFDETSWRAFIDDADLARRTGVFPSALLDPRVLLAAPSALARPVELAAPSALRVSADGTISIGMRGDVIGAVDELSTLLTVPLPRLSAVGGDVPRDVLLADLTNRDWIGRFLLTTDLMKMLRLANGAARISGFGWALLDDGLADAQPPTADPFLLETADGLLLADTSTLRRQLLSHRTAVVVEATQTSSSLDLAAERVTRRLGMATADAHALCVEAVAELGVHEGVPFGAPIPAGTEE